MSDNPYLNLKQNHSRDLKATLAVRYENFKA